jgi:hypothetical protein
MSKRFIIVAISLCCGGLARAEFPQPRLDRIFPLGGEAGTQVIVDIAGRDLEEVKTLHFDHPGLTSEFVEANKFRICIAQNTPVGTHDVRAVGKWGISASRLFVVSRGLTEIRDTEPNDSLDKAQAVPMNSAISGTSDTNGFDYFRFPAKRGERVTLECRTYSLDSLLRPALKLYDVAGKELARSAPYYYGADALLDFVAPADGHFIVSVQDITYSGDLPYRLTISNRPYVDNAFPPVVAPGQKTNLTLLGRNLPGGKKVSALTAQGHPLDEITIPYTGPSRGPEYPFQFLQHIASPVLNGFGTQAWPNGVSNALNPFSIGHTTLPIVYEQEPNDSADKAQKIQLPVVIAGRFDKPGDKDWFTFTAKANEVIAFDLLCERLEMAGDPFVVITDTSGNELTNFDDHGYTPGNALSQMNRDPVGLLTAPADGSYRVLVQDRYHRGGPRFLYALRVSKPQHDFFPVVFHETPGDPTCPTIRQGSAAFYEFCLNRGDGFVGNVTVEAEGLPRGLTCPPIHLGPQVEFSEIVFTAAPDAPEWAGSIRLKAWAMIDGKRVDRAVACVQRRWGDGIGQNATRACRDICLAVRSKAPYGLKTGPEKIAAAPGKAIAAKVAVKRYWPDFKDGVQVSLLNPPAGFEMPTATIPAEKEEISVEIKVAAEVPPGTYSIILRGDAQVPFNPDPKAAEKPKIRVPDPCTPLTVVVPPQAQK